MFKKFKTNYSVKQFYLWPYSGRLHPMKVCPPSGPRPLPQIINQSQQTLSVVVTGSSLSVSPLLLRRSSDSEVNAA